MTGGTLLLARRFDAPVTAVFRAWVDPRRMARWLLPGGSRGVVSVRSDAREGGRFCLEGHYEDGQPFALSGRYLEFVEPTLLVLNWRFEGPDQDLCGSHDVIRVALSAVAPGSTELWLTHERADYRPPCETPSRDLRVPSPGDLLERTGFVASHAGGASSLDRPASMRRRIRSS